MSQSRRDLAGVAAATAMKVRDKADVSLSSPISVYDLCERLGVSVLLQDIPSMEGLYLPDARPIPTIILSSLRPAGRRAMTCGHELGHHVFEHGRQWDELFENRDDSRRFDPEEYQADVFSACLQMPRTAVSHAFARRHLDPEECRAEDVYMLSTLFGVSYEGFVIHLERTLNLIGMKRASILAAKKPAEIKASCLGHKCSHGLVVVDLCWDDRAVDAEVGDLLILPEGTMLEGKCLQIDSADDSQTVLRATTPGIARVSHPTGWCAFARVARRDYVGRAPFRFDEEVSDDA